MKMNKATMRAVFAATVLAAAARGIAGDTDAYVESDGTGGMNTGYCMNGSSRLEVDFALTTTEQRTILAADEQLCVFGPKYFVSSARLVSALYFTSVNSYGFLIGNGEIADKGHWAYDQANYSEPSAESAIKIDTVRHLAVFDLYRDTLSFVTSGETNWTLATGFSGSFPNAAAHPVPLFATWADSDATRYWGGAKARIYGVRIYESDVLVHDFEPCTMDGQPGFRDRETGTFIHGVVDGTSFKAGGDCAAYMTGGSTDVPWVATPSGNSSIYIDTEYGATSNTCFMLDCELRDNWVSGAWYLFYGYGSSPFSGYINASGFGVYVVPDKWKQGILGASAQAKDVRRTFVLDAYNDDGAQSRAYVLNGGVVEATSNIEKANEKNPSSANASVKIGSSWNHNGNFAPLKIYGCKIYEAGVLVRNFRPCIVDGVVGLRDSLTGLFVSYPPSKSRTDVNRLEYGGAISVFGADSVPYIESAGLDGQFILTDYKPCGATRAEIDFEQLYVTKRKFLFGVHATGTEFAFALYAMDTTRTYGYCCQDDDPNWTYEGMPAWTFLRTTLILDAKNRNYAKAESRAAVTNWITGIWTTPSPEKRSQYNLPIFASRQRVSVGGVDLLDDYETASSGYWTGYMPMRLYGFRIYEDDTLVRDYVPTNRDGVVGLQNVLPGGNFLTTWTSPSGVTGPDFVYGTSSTNAPAVIPAAVRLPYRKSVTLMASMPNALSYRWVKNGEYIPGETEAALTIDWECSGVSDVYRVMAIYPVGVDDLTVSSGLSNPIPVEHLSAGLMTIFK